MPSPVSFNDVELHEKHENSRIVDKKIESQFRKIISSSRLKKSEKKLIEKAFYFSAKAHKDQKRASGEPYIVHPLAVAEYLLSEGFGSDVACAALLHDVLEDTDVTDSELKKEFGHEVYGLVESVTKLGKLSHMSEEEELGKNLKKIMTASSKDVRILLIKLYDCLHNIRTIEHLLPEKRKKYAKRILDIFGPIANKFGLHDLKHEIQDSAFQYTNPEEYSEIKKALDHKSISKEEEIDDVINILKKDFGKRKLNAEFRVDRKTVFATYQKMKRGNKTLGEIDDSLIMVILVNSIDDCYLALGRIHQNFRPKPLKTKDFIAIPQGLYQSIHSTVIGPKAKPIKI
ncbi:MAG: HD domain-containing protein, partial [Candidatus Diapherotrites archaeon]|nr:HD domain-containing protein [Candidatus Diapherotrites archaeon]